MFVTGLLIVALQLISPSADAYYYYGGTAKGWLNVFDEDLMVCGKGITTPGLLLGEHPFAACMLKGTKQKGVFGWNEWFR